MPSNTRSKNDNSLPSDEISQGVKDYLDSLILSNINDIKDLIRDLNNRLEAKDKKIVALEKQVECLSSRNDVLEKHIASVRDDLSVRADDLEQYDRKINLRIDNIEFVENETNDELTDKVLNAFSTMDVNISKEQIFRLHRSSKPFVNKGGKTCCPNYCQV